jgi:hypothetical protein
LRTEDVLCRQTTSFFHHAITARGVGIAVVAGGKEHAVTPDDAAPVWMRERRNGLLAGLSAGELARVAPYLEDVAMPLGWAGYESGAKQRYVFFPTTGIVSLLYVMANGSSAEIAVVGNEGIGRYSPVHGR